MSSSQSMCRTTSSQTKELLNEDEGGWIYLREVGNGAPYLKAPSKPQSKKRKDGMGEKQNWPYMVHEVLNRKSLIFRLTKRREELRKLKRPRRSTGEKTGKTENLKSKVEKCEVFTQEVSGRCKNL